MENLNYVAPEVEVIEVEVEKGFATSNGASTPGQSDVDEWPTV